MTRWHWVRHGPTHAKSMIGWTDLPADLTDLAAIGRLRAALPEAAVVVSSDLIRAVATADAIQGERQRLSHVRDLRELHFGAWENRRFDEVSGDTPELIRAFWEVPGDTTAPGGECWRTFAERVNAAVDRISAEFRGQDIIAVAHFGVILTQLERALGLTTTEAFAYRIEPLSLTRLTHDGEAWRATEIDRIC